MTSAEVNLLRNEIVGRLEKIELGLFGEDGLGGLAALVATHLADHRLAAEVREAGSRAAWPRRLARFLQDHWPLIVVGTTITAFVVDVLVDHLTIVLN